MQQLQLQPEEGKSGGNNNNNNNNNNELRAAAGVKAQNHNLTSFQKIEENDLRRTNLLLCGARDQGRNLYTDLSVGHPCSRAMSIKLADTPDTPL